MKIAGKRRIEPDWSSQDGAVRLEQGRLPFCIDWVF